MLTGISSVLSYISIDSGTTYTTTTSSVIDSTNHKITITYTLQGSINSASTLMFIIQGVLSPPTETTTLSSSFSVSTADSNGAKID